MTDRLFTACRRLLMALAVLQIVPVGVLAQSPTAPPAEEVLQGLETGERLRARWSGRHSAEGRLLEVTPGSLVLRTTAGPTAVPTERLETLHVRRSRVRKSLVIGALAGGVLGAALGWFAAGLCEYGSDCGGAGGVALGFGLVGGLAGATVGAFVGALVPRWEAVHPPSH